MNTALDIASIDFGKGDGLVPAIVQDADSGAVLMMAYMNREALEQTVARRRAVFFSRSKQRLWEKGETTGHTLDVVDVVTDCDRDTLLVTARARGPACHNGTLTCFGNEARTAATGIAFLAKLESVIAQRAAEKPEAVKGFLRAFVRGLKESIRTPANAVESVPKDCLWYHANYVAPRLSYNLQRVEKIGAHIFYRS